MSAACHPGNRTAKAAPRVRARRANVAYDPAVAAGRALPKVPRALSPPGGGAATSGRSDQAHRLAGRTGDGACDQEAIRVRDGRWRYRVGSTCLTTARQRRPVGRFGASRESLHAPDQLWYACTMDDMPRSLRQPSSGGESSHRSGHPPVRQLARVLLLRLARGHPDERDWRAGNPCRRAPISRAGTRQPGTQGCSAASRDSKAPQTGAATRPRSSCQSAIPRARRLFPQTRNPARVCPVEVAP